MAWLGSSGGCAVYYFITSWLVGLSNYLVVCLVCMILVREKKTPFGTFEKKLLTHPGEEGSLSVGPPSRVQVPPALPRRHHRPPRHPGALHQVQVLVSFYFEPASNFPPGPLWSPLVRASAFSPQGLIVEREKKDFRLQRIFPRDAMYALYILFKLLLRHLLPVVLVLLCLFRPRCNSPK